MGGVQASGLHHGDGCGEGNGGGRGNLDGCCLVGGLFFDAGCKQDACTTLGWNLDGCCVVGGIVL